MVHPQRLGHSGSHESRLLVKMWDIGINMTKTLGAKTRPKKERLIAELKILKKRLLIDLTKVNRALYIARRLP